MIAKGEPFEFLDGDQLKIDQLFLQALLEKFQNKGNERILVLSVLGPQSSGKSTILNKIFGCHFWTSVGRVQILYYLRINYRCTKGIYLQLLKIQNKNYFENLFDYILILDTEGLQSPNQEDQEFDKKIALFVLTISDTVQSKVNKIWAIQRSYHSNAGFQLNLALLTLKNKANKTILKFKPDFFEPIKIKLNEKIRSLTLIYHDFILQTYFINQVSVDWQKESLNNFKFNFKQQLINKKNCISTVLKTRIDLQVKSCMNQKQTQSRFQTDFDGIILINIKGDITLQFRNLIEMCIFTLGQMKNFSSAKQISWCFNQNNDVGNINPFEQQLIGIAKQLNVQLTPSEQEGAIDYADILGIQKDNIQILGFAQTEETWRQSQATGIYDNWRQQILNEAFAEEAYLYGIKVQIVFVSLQNLISSSESSIIKAYSKTLKQDQCALIF